MRYLFCASYFMNAKYCCLFTYLILNDYKGNIIDNEKQKSNSLINFIIQSTNRVNVSRYPK